MLKFCVSGEIIWVRSLVFSNSFLNCFMTVCGFLKVFPVNLRCIELLVMGLIVGRINLWYGG